MSDVVISLSERRLARDGVKITFFKVVVKLKAIEDHFPGGLEGFVEKYKRISPKKSLIGVTFLNMTAVDEFVLSMQSQGIVQGQDLATANQIHGELIGCEGIQFVTVDRVPNAGTNTSFPVWYACADS